MSTTSSFPTYKSHLSIPYTTPPLPLRTLDIHIPIPPPILSSSTITTPPPSQPHIYTILYIHGGAFRDPLVTSQSLLPSLPHLLSCPPPLPHADEREAKIAAVVAVNYSLCPYPTHPTHPSKPRGRGGEEEGRGARWPDHVGDIRAALGFLFGEGHDDDGSGSDGDDAGKDFRDAVRGSEIVLVGHSVGATIAFALAMGIEDRVHDGAGDAVVGVRMRIRAVVGLAGIYDFTALRDAHAEHRGLYEGFTNEAFGAEEDGGWERGNIVEAVRKLKGIMGGVELVVLGHSKGDELVEWGQVDLMAGALREKGWRNGEQGKAEGKELLVEEEKIWRDVSRLH
ncbi:MAG: hypothetical protein Q9202_001372 [Teloschistes flavicans]